MKYAFVIEYPNGVFTNVSPINAGSLKLTLTRKIDDVEIFFRPKFGTLELRGDDYILIKSIEADTSCNSVNLFVSNNCGEQIYQGLVLKSILDLDLYNCIARINLDLNDKYKCILENKNIVRRGFQLSPTITVTAKPFLMQEYHVEEYVGLNNYPLVAGYLFISEHYFYNQTGCAPANDIYKAIYSRDYILTEIVNGVANIPSGANFVYDTNVIVGGNTFAKWVRSSTNPIPIKYTRQLGFYDPCHLEPNSLYFAPIFDVCDGLLYYVSVCADNAITYSFDNVMPFFTVLRNIFNNSQCEGRGSSIIVSDFFEINPIGDAVGYAPGINYVYGGVNEYTNLILAQKTDITRYNASNNALGGDDITLNDMLNFLYQQFQVYWFINEDGNLRLEHISYFYNSKKLISCGAKNITYFRGTPSEEAFQMMEGYNIDFVGTPIRYDCAKDNKVIYSSDRFSTELEQAILNPTAFEDSGWFVLACDSLNNVIDGIGILSLQRLTNSPLARTILHERFWRHYRFAETFEMNLDPLTNYEKILAPLLTIDCSNTKCCDIEDTINESVSTIFTKSEKQNRDGIITDIEYNLKTGVENIKIKY